MRLSKRGAKPDKKIVANNRNYIGKTLLGYPVVDDRQMGPKGLERAEAFIVHRINTDNCLDHLFASVMERCPDASESALRSSLDAAIDDGDDIDKRKAFIAQGIDDWFDALLHDRDAFYREYGFKTDAELMAHLKVSRFPVRSSAHHHPTSGQQLVACPFADQRSLGRRRGCTSRTRRLLLQRRWLLRG